MKNTKHLYKCKKCGINRSINQFRLNPTYKYGRSNICNACLEPKEKIFKKIPAEFKNLKEWEIFKKQKLETLNEK